MRLLRLRFVSGPRRGEELVFAGPRVRIGRSRDNTLVLSETDAPLSSGRHADAVLERGAWWLVDAGSTNGTFVNGTAVARHRLARGDTLAFGDDQFVVVSTRRAEWLWPIAVAAAAVAAIAAFAAYRRAPVPSEAIAALAARSVYAVIVEDAGRRSVVGTAFAVGQDGILATNAHVANLLRGRTAAGQALAIRSDTDDARRIAAVTIHPDWRPGSIRADVALLRLERGADVKPLPLARAGEFARLDRGMRLASFGFPAVATDPRKPRGRLSVDVVGDVRDDYLEAGLAIAPGTSGSPVFNDSGEVLAIVAGGDFVKGANGMLAPSGSQVNWAISAERVRELLLRR